MVPEEQLGEVALAGAVPAEVEREARAPELSSRRPGPLEVAALTAAETMDEQQPGARRDPFGRHEVGGETPPAGGQGQLGHRGGDGGGSGAGRPTRRPRRTVIDRCPTM